MRVSTESAHLYQGSCLKVLPTLEANSIHCCITSPPYWGQRDYGGGKLELGQEKKSALSAIDFRSFFAKMGFLRFMLMANLLLFMASLPLKMVLRWTWNLKYIVSIPEYFLNF